MPDHLPSTPLAKLIQVRQSGLRSISVEQDIGRTAVATAYTLTPQARSTLARMLTRLTEPGALSHAWTLTGPYGSGKSYFSLFLMNLFCSQLPAHQQLLNQLTQSDPLLSEQVTAYTQSPHTKGFLPIPITGYRASLPDCLWHGVSRALETLLQHQPLSDWYKKASTILTTGSSRQIVTHLQALNEIICSPELGYRGLLMILDEMGKPLEHLANHPQSGDIFLLQELAEFADRSERPFLFVGILHQGFERYAGQLDMTTQREWAKVQGRFADIAFQEPPHQQMSLLAHAIEGTEILFQDAFLEYTEDVLSNGWKPALMSADEFRTLCRQAYPLHPTTLVTLPHLFRRLAQNERSLFSYLGSLEPFGFQEFLQTHHFPDTVRLPDLFDYLVANFQGRLYASMRGRLITETVERLQNAPQLPPLAIALLKAIGLINWLAEVSDLKPNKGTLFTALRSTAGTTADLETALGLLLTHSLIVFRRYNETYIIWQGSDVDLDERMQAAQRKLQGVFRLAHTVEKYMPPRPIVARRHSYRTGFMRFWQMHYVDSSNREILNRTTSDGYAGTVLLCLPTTTSEYDTFIDWSLARGWQESPDFVIGVAQETARLAQLAQELRGLHWIRENTPELRDDPVARRELRTRLNAVEMLIRREVDQTLGAHHLAKGGGCRWFYQGKEVTEQFGRGLSHLLSAISDELYVHSPRLWNELINRRILSSQGAAARRNLIEAMWLRANQPRLGITGFPPERSMYESLLANSGLHRQAGAGQWGFNPPRADDPLSLQPVWSAIEQWVLGAEPQQRSVADLFAELSAPPYGLTDGVLPVLLCAFMLVNHQETTLYREGTLLPAPSVADWEVLLRRPELFAIVGVRVTGPRAAIVQRLAIGLETETAVLPIVRELIHRLRTLPDYAWRTQRLAPATLAFRQTIEQARTPERLLFHDLPLAIGLRPFATDAQTTATELDDFFHRLNVALQELAQAMPVLIASARDKLLIACGFNTGENGWETFRQDAAVLQSYVNQPNLTPLLKRAAETADSNAALESVLAYVANRPPRSWSDADVDRFQSQAARLGKLLQAERSGYDPLATLSPAQRQQSQRLAADLQQFVAKQVDIEIDVKIAALRSLLKQLDQAVSANGHSQAKGIPMPDALNTEGE